MANKLYDDVMKIIFTENLNLLRTVSKIRYLGIKQKIALENYKNDVDFYLRNVDANKVHLVNIDNFLAK